MNDDLVNKLIRILINDMINDYQAACKLGDNKSAKRLLEEITIFLGADSDNIHPSQMN